MDLFAKTFKFIVVVGAKKCRGRTFFYFWSLFLSFFLSFSQEFPPNIQISSHNFPSSLFLHHRHLQTVISSLLILLAAVTSSHSTEHFYTIQDHFSRLVSFCYSAPGWLRKERTYFKSSRSLGLPSTIPPISTLR